TDGAGKPANETDCSGSEPITPAKTPNRTRKLNGNRVLRRAVADQNGLTDSATSESAARLVTPLTKSLRLRDRDHLKFVNTQPCLACGRSPSDAHHLKFAQGRALGRKVSDKFTVPLCRAHHRELHLRGDERIWWQQVNLDPLPVAQRLWQHTRSDTQ